MDKSLTPNFIIAGAAKSGTTSLYHYLRHHPDVFLSTIKEPCFFSFANEAVSFTNEVPNFTTDWEKYLELFRNSHDFAAVGEASTPYLYFHEKSISNMQKYVKECQEIKIIILLRNPIDRAFSQYMHNVRDMREGLSFEDAIQSETERRKNNFHFDFFYVDRGFYYGQVKSYLNYFKNVKIFLYEDLRDNAKAVLKETLDFLGVDKTQTRDLVRLQKFNVSGRPKVKLLQEAVFSRHPAMKQLKRCLPRKLKSKMRETILKYNLRREDMRLETRRYLLSVYEQDVRALSNLIGRDLGNWLKV